MVAITTTEIRAFVASRLAAIPQEDGTEIPDASNAEITRELTIVKRAYRLALQAGKLLHAPHIPMLHEDNVRQGFFERDAFDDVCDALPAPIRPVVTFACLTGWRVPSAVLSLRWGQVDRQMKMIRLEPGHQVKNDEGRSFPYALLPELVDVIEAQWTAHEQLQAAGVICRSCFTGRARRSKPSARRG
jgi:integrase